jgi:hypothetical protein
LPSVEEMQGKRCKRQALRMTLKIRVAADGDNERESRVLLVDTARITKDERNGQTVVKYLIPSPVVGTADAAHTCAAAKLRTRT